MVDVIRTPRTFAAPRVVAVLRNPRSRFPAQDDGLRRGCLQAIAAEKLRPVDGMFTMPESTTAPRALGYFQSLGAEPDVDTVIVTNFSLFRGDTAVASLFLQIVEARTGSVLAALTLGSENGADAQAIGESGCLMLLQSVKRQ